MAVYCILGIIAFVAALVWAIYESEVNEFSNRKRGTLAFVSLGLSIIVLATMGAYASANKRMVDED